MIRIEDPSKCSGCTACESVCPHNALTMKPDILGFLYPEVDFAKCIDCKLCEKVCSFEKPLDRTHEYPISYLAKHNDEQEVRKSKSGAAFVCLSDIILSEGGFIYGAKLNDEHLVEHGRATNQNERDKFRGSKYIQSDLRGIFKQIREDLKRGKKVLFSGTPCQVAGLKSFIGEKLSSNLYLIDILCHGVASPNIWQDHINNVEKRKRKKVIQCIPRNPAFGWYNNVDTLIFEDGTKFNSDYFTGYIYHKWITQRWSCQVCPFTSLNRVSDITLGDAWGANKVAPDFDVNNLGASLMLINSKKGKELFEKGKYLMKYMPVDITKMMQPVLKHPTSLHLQRKLFEEKYEEKGYKYVKFKYLNNTVPIIKEFIWKSLLKLKHSLIPN